MHMTMFHINHKALHPSCDDCLTPFLVFQVSAIRLLVAEPSHCSKAFNSQNDPTR